ncbi:MAG TPA: hypothetical protein PKO33_05485, partial [Pyrinomonadaceae bacterium]|nr:hypothetical protein [Pyrinomonadaceae bacterium]
AIELNDGLAQTHATLGFIRLFHYFDWPAAEAELKTAIGLDANYATAHHWLGVYYTVRGRFDEARVSMLRAQDLDPTSPVIISDLAQLHYFSGDYAKALEYCESARALDPERAWNYGLMSEIMVALGRENEAFEALRQWHRRLSVDPLKRDFEATNPESRSVREFWQRQISKNLLALERDPRRADLCEPLVRYNLLLGNDAEAVKYVDCVFEKGNRFTTAFFGVDPLYDPIRTEPAFQAILKKMNL